MTKVTGFSPFGYYAVILSNCGGFSVMQPPIALFLKELTNYSSDLNSRLLLQIKKSTENGPPFGEPF